MIRNMKTTTQLLEPIFDRIASEYPDFYSRTAYITGEFQKHMILGLLEDSLGNVSEAARSARISRENLWNLIIQYNITPSAFVGGDTLICPDPTKNLQ